MENGKVRLLSLIGISILSLTLSGCSENKPVPEKRVMEPFEAQFRKMEAIEQQRKPLPDSLKNGAHSLTGAIQYLEGHNSIEDF